MRFSTSSLFIAIILGFVFSEFAKNINWILIPVLVFITVISLKSLLLVKPKKKDFKNIFLLLFISYVILGGLILLATWLFIPSTYKPAMYLYALVPPAISILPFTILFKGNLNISFMTEITAYLMSLIILPLGIFFLFKDFFNPQDVLIYLFILLILPFVLSRFLRYAEKKTRKFPDLSVMLFPLLALVFYIVIGTNKDFLLENYFSFIHVFVMIIFIKIFVSLGIIFLFKKNEDKSLGTTYVLFGNLKNTALAIAFTAAIFSTEAAAPLAIIAIIAPFHLLFLKFITNSKSSKNIKTIEDKVYNDKKTKI